MENNLENKDVAAEASAEETVEAPAEETVEAPAEAPATVVCENCGEQLAVDQPFCHKCGHKLGVVLDVNDKIKQFNEATVNNKKKKKKTGLIVLCTILAVLLIGVPCAYFFYFEPNTRYTEAMELYQANQFDEAIEMFRDLGGFKDSETMVGVVEEASRKYTYDEAILLADEGKYDSAIALLESLGNYADAPAKIAEIKADYFDLMQTVYAALNSIYSSDSMLGTAVELVLRYSDLYDASDYLAMSYLYEGKSYRTYYYWSRYSNGYKYIVEPGMATSFLETLNNTNELFSSAEAAVLFLGHPPVEYKALYTAVYNAYVKVQEYHSFIQKEPSVGYSAYATKTASYDSAAKSALASARSVDSALDDKVK